MLNEYFKYLKRKSSISPCLNRQLRSPTQQLSNFSSLVFFFFFEKGRQTKPLTQLNTKVQETKTIHFYKALTGRDHQKENATEAKEIQSHALLKRPNKYSYRENLTQNFHEKAQP